MERKLATIRKINKINPIEGADNIVLATVDGWNVIVRKDENYCEGNLVVYLEVDSFLPVKPEFEFLRKSSYKKLIDGTEGFRLKTVKLRGVVSQGLILPLTSLNKGGEYVLGSFDGESKLTAGPYGDLGYIEEGLDVTQWLGVTKYDAESQVSFSGNAKGSFPSFIPKTDEERVQNIPKIIEQYKDETFYITEKIDGSSFTCYLKDGEFGVCSRNLELKEELVNGDYDRYWGTAKKLQLKEKLQTVSYNISLQGELAGPGIQKNPYHLKELTIFFFNAYNIDEHKYLDWNEFYDLIDKLELKTVPVVCGGITLTKLQEEFNKTLIESLLNFADGLSFLDMSSKREGLVFRSVKEVTGIGGTFNGRLSFKAVSNQYLLKEK